MSFRDYDIKYKALNTPQKANLQLKKLRQEKGAFTFTTENPL